MICFSAPIQLQSSAATVNGKLVEDDRGGCRRPGVEPSSSCDEATAGTTWTTSRTGAATPLGSRAGVVVDDEQVDVDDERGAAAPPAAKPRWSSTTNRWT
jgi:hypothetical protein